MYYFWASVIMWGSSLEHFCAVSPSTVHYLIVEDFTFGNVLFCLFG